MTQFGDLVREARLRKEIKLGVVAHLLTWEHGIRMSAADVSAVERGQKIELLADLAAPMAEILGVSGDRLRFAAKRDAESTDAWGVARVMSFYDGKDGGWAEMYYVVVPWCEDDRVLSGPFAVQADAQREAERMIAEGGKP